MTLDVLGHQLGVHHPQNCISPATTGIESAAPRTPQWGLDVFSQYNRRLNNVRFRYEKKYPLKTGNVTCDLEGLSCHFNTLQSSSRGSSPVDWKEDHQRRGMKQPNTCFSHMVDAVLVSARR